MRRAIDRGFMSEDLGVLGVSVSETDPARSMFGVNFVGAGEEPERTKEGRGEIDGEDGAEKPDGSAFPDRRGCCCLVGWEGGVMLHRF